MKHSLIECHDVSLVGLHNEKLYNISFVLNVSECIDLGSVSWQKETLIDFFSGKGQKISGQVRLNGLVLDSITEKSFQENKVFVVNADPIFLDFLDVSENLFLLRKNSLNKMLINRKAILSQTEQYLSKYHLPFKARDKGQDLSLTDKIYVTILRYLSQGARVLCLNELSRLFTQQQFPAYLCFLAELMKEGVGLIISDNHPEFFFSIAHQFILLKYNTILMKLYDKKTFPLGTKDLEEGLSLAQRDRKKVVVGVPFLTIMNKSEEEKLFIQANKGEILGITGNPDTLHRVWVFLLQGFPDRLSIELDGTILGCHTIDELVQNKIVFFSLLIAHNSYFQGLTYEENVLLPSYPKISHGIFLNEEASDFIFRKDTFLVDDSGLSKEASHTEVHWKTIFLRWKLFNPKVFILYNVVSMLNMEDRKFIKKELLGMAERGTVILQLENSSEYCKDFADRIERLP